MDEAQLLEHVASEHRLEVQRLFAAYVAAASRDGDGGASSIEAFAHALHQRGLLSSEGLKEFMTYHALDVGEVELAEGDAPSKRYELMTLVGAGAMGEVFLGRDPSLKRTVAVKRAHRELADDPVQLRRFLTEAQVTAQLDHPAIVPVYGLERDESGAFAYSMKFVRGVTLTQYLDDARELRESGKLDAAHALRARIEAFVPVLNAVAYAHRRGVVHRDLKPDNIMVGSFGQVLVMDWGIARVLGRGDADATAPPVYTEMPADVGSGKLTAAGAIMGTPAYMSPEQATGREVGPASDQYALGLILQEIVSLAPAVRAETGPLTLVRAMRGLRAAIGDRPEIVPREVRAIIAKATAFKPQDRYPSVAAMAADVHRYLRDESVEADPDRGLRHVSRWVGKHRGLVLAIAAAIAIAAFTTVLLIVRQGELALVAEREAAQQRERAIAGVEALVDRQGERMSERLNHYEALLEGIAATASVVMRAPAPPSGAVAYQYNAGVHDPPELPSYRVPSRAYRQPASLRAEFSASWGVDRAATRGRLDQIARLEPLMRTALLRSIGEDAVGMPFSEAERRVLDEGVPLVWTYVYTEDGLGIALPGTWETYDSPGGVGWDHRREDWYKEALSLRGPAWTVASDGSQFGLTVSGLQAIRDDTGKALGVAGVDIWLDRFIAELLEVPALAEAGAEALLLDKDGAVLVRSSEKALGPKGADWVPKPYEDSALREVVLTGPASGSRAEGGRLAVWTRLSGAGLVYLVIGAEAQLLTVVE